MKINLQRSASNTIIAYDVGSIQVHSSGGGRDMEGSNAQVRIVSSSAIITPDTLIENWQPRTLTELEILHMEPVLGFQPEIVILGTGRRLHFPPAAIIQVCHKAGAGFEAMDTGAACRTYNILAGEGRRVAAALLMIEE